MRHRRSVLLARTVGISAIRASRGLLDVVFPPICLACRCGTAANHGVCPTCWSQLRLIDRPYCERLGTPFPADLGVGSLLSPDAIANPPVYARARAVAHYEGPARLLIHRLKYGDRLDLARALGAWMARAGEELLVEADVLIPVPLHRSRMAARCFNQSALLARTVSAQCGVPADLVALRRIKATRPQVGLTRSQRRTNLQGAFDVPPERKPAVYGKSIVLIDDVMTSGATANAAARILLRAGAQRVDVLVFARVVSGS